MFRSPILTFLKLLYLHMQYELSVSSRLYIGLAIGWSWYTMDEDYDFGELTLHLGLFNLHLRYKKL